MPASGSEPFVDSVGGWRISGRRRSPDRPAADAPLIVALHGGSYSSAYFDLPGFSLLDRAAAAGIPIVALDRPCYGTTTPLHPGTETIRHSAERLDAIVGALVAQSPEAERKVVLIGHSIGAAIAFAIAARRPAWPLAGVAASGMCLDSPAEAGAAWADLPLTTMVDLPAALKDAVMFGAAGTFAAPMPDLSHDADAPVPRAELIDIVLGWPTVAADILGNVRVPVHYRLGDQDRLWIGGDGEVARFAAALSEAPAVDAALLPDSGHCIDFHHRGAMLHRDQLEFARHCAAALAG